MPAGGGLRSDRASDRRPAHHDNVAERCRNLQRDYAVFSGERRVHRVSVARRSRRGRLPHRAHRRCPGTRPADRGMAAWKSQKGAGDARAPPLCSQRRISDSGPRRSRLLGVAILVLALAVAAPGLAALSASTFNAGTATSP